MFRILPLVVLLGCHNDNDLAQATSVDDFIQEGGDEIDVLWVVDNSVSMASEQALVAEGFDQFITSLGAEDGAMDLHIGVVTTDMDRDNPDRGVLLGSPAWLTGDEPDFADQFRTRVRVGTDGSDKEQGLAAAWQALSDAATGGVNAGFLRDSASLAIIFVSDENDCSNGGAFPEDADGALCYEREDELVPVEDYVRHYQEVPPSGRVIASAIVGPEAEEHCDTASPGHRYMGTAEKLNGVVGDVCAPDYSAIMDQLAQQILAPALSFPLADPAQPDTIEVQVDGVTIPEDTATGWWYDAAYQAVRFDGDWYPPYGAEIWISYLIQH